MKHTMHAPSSIVKTVVSIFALIFALIHIIRPALKVDSITLTLFVIGVLPWLYSVVESVKLPGGGEVKFRELEEAGEKITSVSGKIDGLSAAAATEPNTLSTIEQIHAIDPNLAVAQLRIEIERSTRRIAAAHGIADRGPLTTLIRTLGTRGVFPATMVDGLETLVKLGNDAVHGATVDVSAAKWAVIASPEILRSLDSYASNQDGDA